MNIEKRMQDFEKVSKKELTSEDVGKRMEEFDRVSGDKKASSHEKTGSLPYGMKPMRPCPECGEFMDIQEVTAEGANYFCKTCNKAVKVKK